MHRVELLRHGATVSGSGRYCGRSDVTLTAEGWTQMRRAVEGRHWDRIVSSPLRRCAAFAQDIARHLHVDCALDARWQELNFGSWEHRRAADLDAAELGRFWRDPDRYPPPGGERLGSLCKRVRDAHEALRASMKDNERVLVVTHGGPMRVLLSAPGASAAELLGIDVPHAALRACPDAPQ
ncbi:MAG: histidine phosphatase family protein [Panacagrimonas sp.]